jgi:FAD synthetase
VDEAIVGGEGDMLDTVAKVKPDIIVLGYDQSFDEKELEAKLVARGFGNIKVVRADECADDLNATRRIMAKIREMGSQ